MGQSFDKLKKKTLLAAILKSVTVGLSLGVFVAGVLLLAFKLGSVNFHWALYIPVGLGVALVAGGLCLVFLLPTDKKIAIKYDAEYGFNEKLQTMVEFGAKGQEGDIITLQREDALERLSNAPAPKVRFSRIWYFLLIAIVAVAIFFTGIFVPRATQKGSSSDPPAVTPPEKPVIDPDAFEFTLTMQTEMDDLLNAVRDSALEEDFRSFVVGRLVELNKTLIDTTSKTAMLSEVFGAVTDIDNAIVSENSFSTLSAEIAETDADLSKGITQGFITYKGRIMDDMPQSYTNALRSEIGDYIETTMEEYVAASLTRLKVSQLPTDGSKNLKDTLAEYNASLDGALTVSVLADSDDALYQSLKTLYTSLRSIKRQVDQGGTADSVLWGRMDENFGIYQKNAVAALSVQSFKCIMEVFVRQRLADIFNISFGGLAELYAELVYTPGDAPGTGDGTGDGSGSGSGGGGAGSGDVIYGSDDEIYDPRTGEKVQFGVVLKEYENAIINGTAAEDFPPELAKYLESYLNYLHNGTGKTNN